MAEIDTSSYPKAGPGKSALETAAQFGAIKQQAQGIERNNISIASDKLKLLNEHFGIMNKELSNMAGDPNITKDQVIQRLDGITKMLNMPEPVRQQMFSEFKDIATPQQLQQKLQTALQRGMSTQEQINFAYGTPRNVETGQTTTPVVESVRPGFQQRAIGPTMQIQRPPGTVEYDESGQAKFRGTQPYEPPAGPLPVGKVNDPRIQGQSNNFGGNVTGVEVGPNLPVQPLKPTGGFAAPSPMFEEGKRQLAADQEVSKAKLTSIRPALEALPLIKELTISGIGTDKLNKVLAGLNNLGWVSQGITDSTAAYQEVNKKLAQYVGQSGSRSDADLANREAGSPSAKTQIKPALIKLVQDSIALDRAVALTPGAFKDKDYSKYGSHSSTFPAKVDQRVLKLDMMEPKEREDLADKMWEKRNTFEGKKFWDTYRHAKEQGILDLSSFGVKQ